MSNESSAFASLLSVFGSGGLSLLTPAERAELDHLLPAYSQEELRARQMEIFS